MDYKSLPNRKLPLDLPVIRKSILDFLWNTPATWRHVPPQEVRKPDEDMVCKDGGRCRVGGSIGGSSIPFRLGRQSGHRFRELLGGHHQQLGRLEQPWSRWRRLRHL
jgi:hypothetical protein